MGILDASSGVVLAAAMAPTALAHSPSHAPLHRMALNCGSQARLPEYLSGFCIEGAEPTIQIADKRKIACG